MNTKLSWAVMEKDLKLVKELVIQGEDINQKDISFHTPITLACFLECHDIAEFLIKSGAELNGSLLPLSFAVANGYLPIVKLLVDYGANIHRYKDVAIKVASRVGHIEIVKFLHQKGCNIDWAIEAADISIKGELIYYKNCGYEKEVLEKDLQILKQAHAQELSRRI